MDKSSLQVRAENASQKFKQKARRPIVIEFAGVPKAGKTTTLNTIHSFLKRCGFRVETVIERASVCPIRDKKHFNFNVWTACTSLAQILEKTQEKTRDQQSDSDPEILILDRGIFDSLSWLSMMEKMGRLRKEERKTIEEFLLISDWRERMAGVIVMTTSPKDAMAREGGYLPVQTKGSIMNEQVIQQMLANTNSCMERFRNKFNIVAVDTSSSKQSTAQKTAEEVADLVLSMIEGELDEEILSIDKNHFDDQMKGRDCLNASDAQSLVDAFTPQSQGTFGLRDVVEQDGTRIQALPVVVIRNKSGQILQLKRKEKNHKNPLHEKLVIWAGGHVRKEDSLNGDPIIFGAIRELQEELRLRVEPQELKLLGAIYDAAPSNVSKHVAIVYEWHAQSDDVNVVLNSTEFYERRGASQSGRFIGLSDLLRCVEEDLVVESWSVKIVMQLLENSPGSQRSHFMQQQLI
jgi:predicted NUDIX family phosphoesterase/predicted ATPase